MERYIGTKIVVAEPMDKFHAARNGLVRDSDVVTIEADGTSEPGYKVVYEDGYQSWSPKATFDRAYRRLTDGEISLIEHAQVYKEGR